MKAFSGSPTGLVLALAVSAPLLLAYNSSPSPTFLNQALAFGLWGWVVVACGVPRGWALRGAGIPLAALGLIALGVAWSWSVALPSSFALLALGTLAAGALMLMAGAGIHARADRAQIVGDFALAWVLAGALCSVVGILQVFTPDWLDGQWIATSAMPGRAVGNMRQPNHLSSVLTWGAVACVGAVELRRLNRGAAAALFALMLFGAVLTASRTAMLSVVLMAVWAVADRRLGRTSRVMLGAAPVLYAAFFLGMAEWAHLSAHAFGGEERLAQTDISSSRFGIWKNTLAMIAQQPWTGTGFGEFNLAWTLTPFPGRPVAFFDHAHNLPLHLVAELGVPLGGVVSILLIWALVQAAWRAFVPPAEGEDRDTSTGRRFTFAMVVLIAVHSLLEYPLWYSYFLLPAAWALGVALGRSEPQPSPRRSIGMVVAGITTVVLTVLAMGDYFRVVPIYSPDQEIPLAFRVALGQRSVLFSHNADYAAATTSLGAGRIEPTVRARHYLLDTRLMIAWAKALAANGRVEEARYVVDRLREFHNADAADFLGECDKPATSGAKPFQCTPAAQPHGWREFLRP